MQIQEELGSQIVINNLAVAFMPMDRKKFGWNDPSILLSRHTKNLLQATSGRVSLKTIWVVLDEFPMTETHRRYTPQTYGLTIANPGTAFRANDGSFDMVDYTAFWKSLNAAERVDSGNIDEISVMGGPFMGFYESMMNGEGAYWCNSSPVAPITKRRFVTMGYSIERGEAEMMEDILHRAESVLFHKYGSVEYFNWAYNFESFGKPLPTPKNEFEQYLFTHGTAHRVPGSPAYDIAGNQLHYNWNGDPLKHHIDWLADMPEEWITLIFKTF